MKNVNEFIENSLIAYTQTQENRNSRLQNLFKILLCFGTLCGTLFLMYTKIAEYIKNSDIFICNCLAVSFIVVFHALNYIFGELSTFVANPLSAKNIIVLPSLNTVDVRYITAVAYAQYSLISLISSFAFISFVEDIFRKFSIDSTYVVRTVIFVIIAVVYRLVKDSISDISIGLRNGKRISLLNNKQKTIKMDFVLYSTAVSYVLLFVLNEILRNKI